MRWRADDEGTSTLASFIIATSVFTLAFASVTYFASDYIAKNEGAGENLDAVAAIAAATLTSSPGAPSNWETLPASQMQRWGLLSSGSESTLGDRKIAAVKGWGGDFAQYVRAKEAVGLKEYNMRVRLYPKFESLSGDKIASLSQVSAALIAAYDAQSKRQPYADAESVYLANTGVTFNNATADWKMSDGWTKGDVFNDTNVFLTRHLTPRLAGLLGAEDRPQYDTASYWKVVNKTKYPCGGLITDATVTHFLTTSNCVDGAWAYGSTMQAGDLAAQNDRVVLLEIDASTLGDTSRDAVNITLKHWASGVAGVPGLDDVGMIEFYCTYNCGGANGWGSVPLHSVTTVGSAGSFVTSKYDISGATMGKKGFLALSWYAWRDAPAPIGGSGWFVSSVTVTMDDEWQRAMTWTNPLNFSMSRYGNLVVGSDTTQANFVNSADPVFEHALEDWVRVGGDLLVTGNANPQSAWLSPFRLNGPPSSIGNTFFEDKSDHLHQLLNNPYHLRYTLYNPPSQTYKIDENYFNRILWRRDTQTSTSVPLVSVPNANSTKEFKGVVVVTAYRPIDMGPIEAQRFYANGLVYQRFHDLEIDYGSSVPKGSNVGSATRTVVLNGANYGLGRVEADLVVHVWR